MTPFLIDMFVCLVGFCLLRSSNNFRKLLPEQPPSPQCPAGQIFWANSNISIAKTIILFVVVLFVFVLGFFCCCCCSSLNSSSCAHDASYAASLRIKICKIGKNMQYLGRQLCIPIDNCMASYIWSYKLLVMSQGLAIFS